ncbi:MAG: aldehyde oxidase, partial [Caldilineaceae bacterium]|nr:aldehyde oxidase [Caldilineaceae bacterium]
MRAVGSSLQRIDAVDKVTGRAAYPGDIDLPNQVWAKIRFAGVAHARITRMDTSAAEDAPGVLAVLTAKDVPHNGYGLIMPDQPVLCGVGSTAQAEIVRWEADHVAVVVAETAAQAEAAAKLIEI